MCGFGIIGAIDQSIQASIDQCPCAHWARFERDIYCTVQQSPGTECGCGGSQCDHLGVSGGVLQLLALVISAADDAITVHDDGADGHIADGKGRLASTRA